MPTTWRTDQNFFSWNGRSMPEEIEGKGWQPLGFVTVDKVTLDKSAVDCTVITYK